MFLSKVVEFEIGETAKQKVNKTVSGKQFNIDTLALT